MELFMVYNSPPVTDTAICLPEALAGMALRQILQHKANRGVILYRSITVAASAHVDYPAYPTDAEELQKHYLGYHRPFLAGCQSFFSMMYFAASRSRARFAYIFLSLAFSSSRLFSFLSSLDSRPP